MWVQIILEKMKLSQEALKLTLNLNELIEFEQYKNKMKQPKDLSP